MRRVLRAIGVVMLIAASLNATAGLCFCHDGPDAATALPGNHGCCHGADSEGATAVSPVGSCCHIESAAREMTTNPVVQLAQPIAPVSYTPAPAHEAAATRSIAPITAPSPPIRVLRL